MDIDLTCEGDNEIVPAMEGLKGVSTQWEGLQAWLLKEQVGEPAGSGIVVLRIFMEKVSKLEALTFLILHQAERSTNTYFLYINFDIIFSSIDYFTKKAWLIELT